MSRARSRLQFWEFTAKFIQLHHMSETFTIRCWKKNSGHRGHWISATGCVWQVLLTCVASNSVSLQFLPGKGAHVCLTYLPRLLCRRKEATEVKLQHLFYLQMQTALLESGVGGLGPPPRFVQIHLRGHTTMSSSSLPLSFPQPTVCSLSPSTQSFSYTDLPFVLPKWQRREKAPRRGRPARSGEKCH